MPSTALKEFKSKEACPKCEAHKLFTNDTAKGAPVVRYHCLACNHQFTETADEKESKKEKKKREEKENPSNSLGAVVIALMTIVILAITIAQQGEQEPQETPQSVGQVEQSVSG